MQKKGSELTLIFFMIFLILIMGSATLAQAETAQGKPKSVAAEEQAGPSELYMQIVRNWAKVTHFPENAADVIAGKLKLTLEKDPKMQKVMSPEMMIDLQQFFYELFYSEDTMRGLAKIFSQYFTLEEMIDLVKFYQTPLGQKLVATDANLRIQIQELGTKLLKAHEKQYMGIVAKYLVPEEAKKEATKKK